jgi:hypothetical protein
MCRPIFISPKQLRYRGIWKPSAGWNSMGRLVVPFLQSPEPVLEKNSTTATSTASAWHEVNASMPGLSDVRCVVVLRWTGAQLSTWDTHPDKPNHFISLTAASGLSPPQGKLQVKRVKHSPHPGPHPRYNVFEHACTTGMHQVGFQVRSYFT